LVLQTCKGPREAGRNACYNASKSVSEPERLERALFAAFLCLLTLARGMRQFSGSADGMADLVDGLTQATDGVKCNIHGLVLCF